MKYQDFIELLKKQIYLMSYKRQLELALTICKELFFDYQKFSETYNWGDPDLLMDAINISQKSTEGFLDIIQIQELIPKIDSIIPDLDDYGSELGSYALNASASVGELLEFLTDKDQEHVFNIATYYTDTIDFRIQEKNNLTLEQIDKHPLMLEARNFLLIKSK